MKEILDLKILLILLHTSIAQFLNYPPQGIQNYFPYQHMYNGMVNHNLGRRSFRRKASRIGRTVPLSSESVYTESEYTDSSEKCTCSYRSCNECYKAKPCCKSMCQTCNAGVVVIPYPVPFLIVTTPSTTQAVNASVTEKVQTSPGISTSKQVTSSETITTSSEFKSTPKASRSTSFGLTTDDDLKRHKLTQTQSTKETTYTDTSEKKKRKCPVIPKSACVPKQSRRTISKKMQRTGIIFPEDRILLRPTVTYSQKKSVTPSRRSELLMPKFGIVPIPDNIALKLLSQLHDFNSYKSENFSEYSLDSNRI